MEFVEGNTVTYWLQAAERSWQDILRVFMAAGRGLAAAHEKGLVHRDFKPDNVMVGRDNQVRVMDFGLARQMNEKSAAGDKTAGGDKTGGTAASERSGHGVSERSGHGVSERSGHGASERSGHGASERSGHGEHQRASTPAEEAAAARADHGAVPDLPVEVAATVVLSGTAAAAEAQAHASASGMFDVQLTKTGAMMGTPAYMAPEQFLFTPTDARTDQFSFCVALYEALYGERPFAGNTMYALTNNVVQGKVRDAPATANVPLWIRRILLRGLRPAAGDRYQSMSELLDALGKNPSIKRRNVAVFVASALLPAAIAVAINQTTAQNRAVCGGGPARLAGVWDLQRPGEPEPARRARIKNAFLRTGKSYANEAYATVDRVLTGYAQNWVQMHEEACEATHIH